MKQQFLIGIYLAVSVVTAIAAVVVGALCFQRKENKSLWLGIASLFGAVVIFAYTFSIFASTYFYMSVFSSIYFLSIDVMLVALLEFTILFTRNPELKWMKVIYYYGIFDVLVMVINPFSEIAIHYQVQHSAFLLTNSYTYVIAPLYALHLTYTYLLVFHILYLLFKRIFRIPHEHQRLYSLMIFIILLIVVVNGIYIFVPGALNDLCLDYSVWGYAVGAILIYWICVVYGGKGAPESVRTAVFDSISQGIVMFDFDDYLIMKNKTADKIFARFRLNENTLLNDFIYRCNLAKLNEEAINKNEECSIQCYVDEVSYRCDYRPLLNEKGQMIGRMFAFTDITAEADLLTGFHNWEYFKHNLLREKEKFAHNGVVYVADINGLTNINQHQGRKKGDSVIKELADIIKKQMPSESYFIRSNDAMMIVISWFITTKEAKAYALKVEEEFEGTLEWAVAPIDDGDIFEAVDTATASMHRKKLIDNNATRSNSLSSLIRALKETDDDTEEHVLRTQKMGDSLGRRLGLSDAELSKLSLLCVLHDIGKIGVPLEVLNKPGKLTDEEWELMQTHVEKGYQIAKSSAEIDSIANAIRYHHERWDGEGYPDGLSGNQIPLLSRIIAIVDAHDAMTHDRVYHAAISEEEAEEELLRCAGSQFDPFITKEFIEVLKTHVEQTKKKKLEESSIVNTLMEERFVHEVHYSCYELDKDMHITSIDEAFTELTGWTMDVIKDRHMKQIDLIPEEDRMEYLSILNVKLSNDRRAYFEHRLLCHNGEIIYVNCFGRLKYNPVRKEESTEIVISSVVDNHALKTISQNQSAVRHQRREIWQSDYYYDNLTGLLTFDAVKIDAEFRMLKGEARIVYMKMDMDMFKAYEKEFGDKKAQKLLAHFAEVLEKSLRENDLACREDDDQFVAVLFFPKNTEVERIETRISAIYQRIDLSMKAYYGGFSYSMSVVVADKAEHPISQFTEMAENILNHIKETGRNRLEIGLLNEAD